MKRVGWLYNEVLDIENVYEAMNDFNRRRPVHRRIWHRIMRNVDKFRSDPENEKLYRSLMSRLGWLKAINRECSKPFEEERGKLWK